MNLRTRSAHKEYELAMSQTGQSDPNIRRLAPNAARTVSKYTLRSSGFQSVHEASVSIPEILQYTFSRRASSTMFSRHGDTSWARILGLAM